jgi:hypothetical protein
MTLGVICIYDRTAYSAIEVLSIIQNKQKQFEFTRVSNFLLKGR